MTFWDWLTACIAGAAIWLGGEGGRVMVAGGAGALVRWWHSDGRRIRDGLIAAAGGAIAAKYLWPVPFHIIGMITGPLQPTMDNKAMAGFLAGALGMGLIKVLSAMIEARVAKGGGNA